MDGRRHTAALLYAPYHRAGHNKLESGLVTLYHVLPEMKDTATGQIGPQKLALERMPSKLQGLAYLIANDVCNFTQRF